MSGKTTKEADRKIVIERTYEATIEEVWELWTTEEGIESWWGPGGYSVEVKELDLRPGGEMCYAMTAIGAAQIQFMKQAGMPLTTEAKLTYTGIAQGKRIAYTHRVDFIPGVEPYEVENAVEFFADGNRVRMVVTLGPMHNDEWTNRARMGMEGQLSKLDRRFANAQDVS